MYRIYHKKEQRYIEPNNSWFLTPLGRVYRDNFDSYESQPALITCDDFLIDETDNVVIVWTDQEGGDASMKLTCE